MTVRELLVLDDCLDPDDVPSQQGEDVMKLVLLLGSSLSREEGSITVGSR